MISTKQKTGDLYLDNKVVTDISLKKQLERLLDINDLDINRSSQEELFTAVNEILMALKTIALDNLE